jgi:hypothetical protein
MTGMRLTKPCQTFAGAEKQAERLSREASYTVEIWNLDNSFAGIFAAIAASVRTVSHGSQDGGGGTIADGERG